MRRLLPGFAALTIVSVLLPSGLSGQLPPDLEMPSIEDVLIPAGVTSGLPLVQANDNRTPAGTERDGIREISLVVRQADWRVETPRSPGLRVAAVAEEGAAPSIPAPLIRVEEGTLLRVRVRNDLADDSITVFGLHTRPSDEEHAFSLGPGEATTVEFPPGAAGTYLYSIRTSEPLPMLPIGFPSGERQQLAGAFVVDPAGGSPPDEIVVINIFSQLVEGGQEPEFVEGLTVNGLSWPYSKLFELEVGQTQRWRVVNASQRFHPMHLHGFFYSVQSRGTRTGDTLYAPESYRSVVTEAMRGETTMFMEWTPTREGRWLFHCHLSFHVAAGIRLPGAEEADAEHAHSHMAGLVVGIDVAPGPTDLVAEGEPVEMDLYVKEFGDEPGYRYGFTLDPDARPDSLTEAPGPVLVFDQYQAADVTVRNQMSVPTGIHWHGLELDAWADGVPTWSASAGRVSPVIEPGESFTYRLSMIRPGTFIYHSHLNDIDQLTGGLYGALIVLPPGETLDRATDHVRVMGWNHREPTSIEQIDLNGTRTQPDAEAVVGETHRFRVINIAPAGQISAWITRDDEVVPITLHAKDGADLPPFQQVPVDRLPVLGVGETADFTWTPSEPGVYELRIGRYPDRYLPQRWVVTAATPTERGPGVLPEPRTDPPAHW
jgi:FtsP/CotA-like multicopper oxidase with cupredoxin domain